MADPKPIGDFVADSLAGYSLSQAIVAAHHCGLWAAFEGKLDRALALEAFAAEHGLELRYLQAMTDFLRLHQVLEAGPSAGEIKLAKLGQGLVMGGLGPFLLVVGGYGGVLAQMGPLIRRDVRFEDIKGQARNGGLVALGTDLASRRPGGNYALALDRAAAGPADVVMDLGCGSAKFLTQLIQRTGAKRGIGVEVDAKACELARATLADAGLADRCEVLHADIRDVLERHPDVVDRCDVVTGLFVVHEFFRAGFDSAVAEFQAMRRLLRPGGGRLVLVDKVTDPVEAGQAHSTMLDFKLFHDFTDQRLYARDEWARLFAAAGLRATYEKEVIAPNGHSGTVVYECVRDAA